MLDARQKTKIDLTFCEVQIRTNFTALTHHTHPKIHTADNLYSFILN